MSSPDLQFLSLRVKNSLVYRNQYFPLDKQGIVSILGDNGVGKSSIWGLVETCLFGSLPGVGGHKGDALIRDDQDAAVHVELLRKEAEQIYHIIHFRQKGKWNYKVLAVNGMGTPECDHKFKYDKVNKTAVCTRKDCKFLGRDETAHGYPDQKKQVAKIIGLTKEEFEGSVHLTQNNMHVLIDGKPSERKAYISDFFNLDDRYDKVLEEAKAERNKVTDEIEKLGGLVHTQETLATEIIQYSYQDLGPIESQIKQIELNRKDLAGQQRALQQERLLFARYLELLPEAEAFDSAQESLNEMEQRRSTLQVSLKDCEQIKVRNARAQQNNAQIAELESVKRSLESQYSKLPEILSSGIDLSTKIAELQNRKNLVQRQQSLQKEIASLPQNPEQISTLDLVCEAQRLYSEIQHIKTRSEALKDGKCPTCGSEHDVGTVQSELDRVPELQAQYTDVMQDLKVIENKNNGILKRKELEKQLGSLELFTEQDSDQLFLFLDYQQPLRKYQDVSLRLTSSQFQPIESETSSDSLVKEIAECESIIRQLRTCVQAQQELAKLNYTPKGTIELLDVTYGELCQQENEAAQTEAELRTKHGELKGQNDRYTRLRSQLDSLNQRLGMLPEFRQMQAYWEGMVDAFGPKGLRVQQLKKIMDMVISRLPYYAQFLFREKGLSFSHVCDAGNIFINAHRTGLKEEEDENGAAKMVPYEFFHDIATFSGGEKKRLSVALVLTLADCVVRSKQTNLLILDEVDANLDATGQYLFVNELLPFLREKYSSVFIISHDSVIKQAAVYESSWLLTKENHWTVLTIESAA
jgi:DNA repair exonuclease SbcCD ATPase subunit